MSQTQVIYLLIFTLVVMAGVLLWQNVKLGKWNEVLRMAQADRKAKVEFMIRELNKVYEGNKNKTYCLGNIDTLKWTIGEISDDKYWGWVMAQKQINKKGEKTMIETDDHYFIKSKYGEGFSIGKKLILNNRAAFATELIIRHVVMGAQDGEDSAGRQKIKPMNEEEVVQRACKIADLAFTEFENRGWLTKIPLNLE